MKAPSFHTTVTNNSLSSCLISQVPVRMVERDNSWSSTLAVDNDNYNNENDLKSSNRNNKNKEALHNNGMKKNKNGYILRNVKFNERANVYVEDYYDSDSEPCSDQEHEQENVVNACWYNDDDYKEFHWNTNFGIGHFTGLEVQMKQKGECGFTSVIKEVYSLCCGSVDDGDESQGAIAMEVLQEDDYNVFYGLYEDDFNLLSIGIEKYIIREIVAGKRERREKLMHWVEELQDQFEWENEDDLTETLRQISEDISRPSRMFSHCLAFAQFQSSC